MKNYQGNLNAENKKFAIVVSRFNELITDKLTIGAKKTLLRHGARPEDITICEVPGAFELPLICMELAKTGMYQGVIALGCVIKGATPHFDYVCTEATRGLGEVSLKTGIPVGFGLLTTDNLEQALERAGSKGGNKGSEAAVTTLEMANLILEIKENN